MMTANEQAVSAPAITLPRDQYAHKDAATEWWWHVGTLNASDGRTFGFEINAAMMFGNVFTQISLADVAQKKDYQKVNMIGATPAGWAEEDPSRHWYVKLGAESSGEYITMVSIDQNPMEMHVKAAFTDAGTGVQCAFDMKFRQKKAPLLVWGTGCRENVDPKGTSPITRNNYYYSLTDLEASGTITIDSEVIDVTGLTWMDHEYGAFPPGYKWVFQNVQLENGIHFSNYSEGGQVPTLNKPLKSAASVLFPDGITKLIPTVTTPLGPVFTFDDVTYFMGFRIEIDSDELKADLELTSLIQNQVFVGPMPDSNVYEGIGSCTGKMNGKDVKGTAWLEQNIAANPAS